MARNVASSALDALGVDADDVAYIEVAITSTNGAQTTTNITADGPYAGHLVRDMLSAVDHDDHPPDSISVALDTVDDTGGDESEPAAADDDDGDDEGDETDGANATAAQDDTADGGLADATTLYPGSAAHAALSAVAAYVAAVGGGGGGGVPSMPSGGDDEPPGVDAAEILRVVDMDYDQRKLQKALVTAANSNRVLAKAKTSAAASGGVKNLYTLNDAGLAFLAEHGAHSAVNDPVAAVTETLDDDDGHPYANMRKGAQDRDYPEGAREGSTYAVRQEPRVDEPKPPSANTRAHEMLWTLLDYAEAHPDDPWLTAAEAYRRTDFDFPSRGAVNGSLSGLFVDRAMVERRKRESPHDRDPMEYRPTGAGRAAIKRLGEPHSAD